MSLYLKAIHFIAKKPEINAWLLKTYIQRLKNQYIKAILVKANDKFPISKYRKATDLIAKSAFEGMILNIFNVYTRDITVKDIAISMNIALSAHVNKNTTNLPNIIDLAYHVSDELKVKLVNDPVLKSLLSDEQLKRISKFDVTVSRDSIEKLFNNNKLLFVEYFKTFNDSRFNFGIKVWHNGQDTSWIDWQEENSLIIKLNPARIRRGFFLLGFDYQDEKTGQSLVVATYENGYEVFNGTNYDKSIWVR